MTAPLRLPLLTCRRCGHRWVPTASRAQVDATTGATVPVRVTYCPRCKSALWREAKRGSASAAPPGRPS